MPGMVRRTVSVTQQRKRATAADHTIQRHLPPAWRRLFLERNLYRNSQDPQHDKRQVRAICARRRARDVSIQLYKRRDRGEPVSNTAIPGASWCRNSTLYSIVE